MSPYYGLRGTSLNVAIAVIAGTDFALFGYDQASGRLVAGYEPDPRDLAANINQGVMGGLLTLPSFLETFPEINVQHPPPGSDANKASNTQGTDITL